jgi:hypothetical protein
MVPPKKLCLEPDDTSARWFLKADIVPLPFSFSLTFSSGLVGVDGTDLDVLAVSELSFDRCLEWASLIVAGVVGLAPVREFIDETEPPVDRPNTLMLLPPFVLV